MIRSPEAHHRYLAGKEPVFARIIAEHGLQNPFAWHDGGRTGSAKFPALFLHILSQRINAAGSFTLYDRTAQALSGTPTAAGLRSLGLAQLRGFGLSETKAACALTLATAQCDGDIDVEHMEDLSDAEVVSALTAFKGLGVWSAQAFLMRQLKRPDVLPASDAGIRQALKRNWGTSKPPTQGEVRRMSEAWSPSRSYAATLLWRSLKPAGEAYDPKERALLAAAARPARHEH